MGLLTLNPITQKRLQRFRKTKRAYYSFWLLLGLYVVGLFANFICNDQPLYIRYEGKSYFPFINSYFSKLCYYPEDTFLENGVLTRADYKAIEKMPRFAQNEDNYMVFAPVRFSPYESISADSIDVEQTVTVAFRRLQQVATVNVKEDYTISKSQSAGFFFDGKEGRALKNTAFEDYWPIPESIKTAIAQRFRNETATEASAVVNNTQGTSITISLSEYSPRSRAPRTVRMSLREMVTEAAPPTVDFNPQLTAKTPLPPIWATLTEAQQTLLKEKTTERFDIVFEPIAMQIGQAHYEVSFAKEDVYFPFRPTPRHWMGLDSSGRDVFARVLYALRTSLSFGFVLVLVTMLIGIAIGAVQGYLGGFFDLVGQRAIEIWEALPFLYIIILMGSVYGRSFELLLVVYAIFNWVAISYYMRGEFLKLRKQPFVEAAHCMGLPSFTIMLRHILPNALVPVITFFPFSLVSAIGSLAALDYLGFGLPPPTPSWGDLLSQGQEYLYAWWLVFFPAVILFLVGLLGVFIGEGARAAFDPRADSHIE